MKNSPEQELPDLVRQALTLLRDGKPEAARLRLIQYVRNNPNSEYGWYLLSQAVIAPREQADCLRQVLRLNPRHLEAQTRLKRLLAAEPPPNPTTPAQPSAPAGEARVPAPGKTPEPPPGRAAPAQPPALVEEADLPAPSKTPEPPSIGPVPAQPDSTVVTRLEPVANENAPIVASPVGAQPGEETHRVDAEPTPEPKPKARTQRRLSCAKVLGAAILATVIILGLLAAIIFLPSRLNLAIPSQTPYPTLSPTISRVPTITPTPLRFPTLPPAWTATFTPSPVPTLTPTFTPMPLPSETATETPAGGPVGFGTPLPSPGAAISATNAVSLTQVALWKLPEPSVAFTCLAVAPDGQTIAAGANDGTVHLWQTSDGGGERVFKGHSETVSSLAFAPDGKTLLSGANDKTVQLWSVSDGTQVHTFQGHTAAVTSVAFAPNGQSIASGSLDGTTRVWNASNGTLRYQVPGKVAGLAFSPDGQALVIAGEDKIRLTRASTGAVLYSLKATLAYGERLAFSPDGTTLATSSAQAPAQLWHASDGSLTRSFVADSPKTTAARLSDNVTFSPDGQLLASGTVDGRILVWLVSTGDLKASLETGASEVLQVAFAPDDQALFSLSLDGTLLVWRVP